VSYDGSGLRPRNLLSGTTRGSTPFSKVTQSSFPSLRLFDLGAMGLLPPRKYRRVGQQLCACYGRASLSGRFAAAALLAGTNEHFGRDLETGVEPTNPPQRQGPVAAQNLTNPGPAANHANQRASVLIGLISILHRPGVSAER